MEAEIPWEAVSLIQANGGVIWTGMWKWRERFQR